MERGPTMSFGRVRGLLISFLPMPFPCIVDTHALEGVGGCPPSAPHHLSSTVAFRHAPCVHDMGAC
jgi:hypothetical protein